MQSVHFRVELCRSLRRQCPTNLRCPDRTKRTQPTVFYVFFVNISYHIRDELCMFSYYLIKMNIYFQWIFALFRKFAYKCGLSFCSLQVDYNLYLRIYYFLVHELFKVRNLNQIATRSNQYLSTTFTDVRQTGVPMVSSVSFSRHSNSIGHNTFLFSLCSCVRH